MSAEHFLGEPRGRRTNGRAIGQGWTGSIDVKTARDTGEYRTVPAALAARCIRHPCTPACDRKPYCRLPKLAWMRPRHTIAGHAPVSRRIGCTCDSKSALRGGQGGFMPGRWPGLTSEGLFALVRLMPHHAQDRTRPRCPHAASDGR